MTWETLRTIREGALAEAEVHARMVPTNCPHDGTVLDRNLAGALHCPFDGWIWDGIEYVPPES